MSVEYKSIGGWLLILCLFLTLFDPAAMLLSAFLTVDELRPQFATHPELFRLSLVAGMSKLALAVFSMYTGLLLWRIQPRAIKTASVYFRIIFLYSLLAVFLPHIVGVSRETLKNLSAANLLNCLSVFVFYVVVWPLYLKRSRRVKATYGSETTNSGLEP